MIIILTLRIIVELNSYTCLEKLIYRMVICGQDRIYHVMSYDTGQLLAHFNVIIDYVVGLKQ